MNLLETPALEKLTNHLTSSQRCEAKAPESKEAWKIPSEGIATGQNYIKFLVKNEKKRKKKGKHSSCPPCAKKKIFFWWLVAQTVQVKRFHFFLYFLSWGREANLVVLRVYSLLCIQESILVILRGPYGMHSIKLRSFKSKVSKPLYQLYYCSKATSHAFLPVLSSLTF